MRETLAKALIRPALHRFLLDRGGEPWSGTPSNLLVMLAGFVSDPLPFPVNARAFSVYMKKLAAPLAGDGVEVIRRKSHGNRMVTVRLLPTAKCTECGSASYRLTDFHDRLVARWICAWCNPSRRNPFAVLNIASGPPKPEYWRSWAYRPESATSETTPLPPSPEPPSNADPVLVAIRDFVLSNARSTRLGPMTWLGMASELYRELTRKGSDDGGLPSCVELLAKKLGKSVKELWMLGVDLGYQIRGRHRMMALQVVPARDCRQCGYTMFWLDGARGFAGVVSHRGIA